MVATGIEVRELPNGRFVASYPLLGIEVEHFRECFAVQQANETRVRILRQLLREAESDLRGEAWEASLDTLATDLPIDDDDVAIMDLQQQLDSRKKLRQAQVEGFSSYEELRLAQLDRRRELRQSRGEQDQEPKAAQPKPPKEPKGLIVIDSSAFSVPGEQWQTIPSLEGYEVSENGAVRRGSRSLTIRTTRSVWSFSVNYRNAGSNLKTKHNVAAALQETWGEEAAQRWQQRADAIFKVEKEKRRIA